MEMEKVQSDKQIWFWAIILIIFLYSLAIGLGIGSWLQVSGDGQEEGLAVPTAIVSANF